MGLIESLREYYDDLKVFYYIIRGRFDEEADDRDDEEGHYHESCIERKTLPRGNGGRRSNYDPIPADKSRIARQSGRSG